MSFLRQLSRLRPCAHRQCVHRQLAHPLVPIARLSRKSLNRDTKVETNLQNEERNRQLQVQWDQQAGRIEAGMQQGLLNVLEERGFVKDIAGGRQNLNWLLTKKRIGAYVGIDPTAPSLHVGHLLPLMVLFWMHLHGYYTYTLVGGGTVKIGDPSGRTTARSRQATKVQYMNTKCILDGLGDLWTNVKCLGIKHQYQAMSAQKNNILNNQSWLDKLSAVELMRNLGSSMRLGPMLSRDSVKLRMESGEGMAFSEFSYPLFQAYDWWHMYQNQGVQMQIGGSDQYGNIIAGMDAVGHMRKLDQEDKVISGEDISLQTYGLTTPLLTTASGEKFGKSAGNAVWLDQAMTDSFQLYQYFIRTADDDVERYLKFFTFLPMSDIKLLMGAQKQDPSKRVAQHILAKEVVELAHGAYQAKRAETAHREAFQSGTNVFPLSAIRIAMDESTCDVKTGNDTPDSELSSLIAWKQSYAGTSTSPTDTILMSDARKDTSDKAVVVPSTMLKPGSFPQMLVAAGLATSKSEARRLIAKKGAYVVVPNSGKAESPTLLQWSTIESGAEVDPSHFLVDREALVLRAGKTKVQIVKVVLQEHFVEAGLTCPGWDEFKAGENP